MVRRIIAALVLSLIAAAALAVWLVAQGRIAVPDRFNPFTPLDVAAEPGPLTSWKFWRATQDPQQCIAALATSGMRYTLVADQDNANGCNLTNTVRVERLARASMNHTFLATCPLALALAMTEQHAWQPAAESTYGKHIARIDHVGSYACRNVNHASEAPLSEHARANAIDLEDFVLDGGTRISVAHDWDTATLAGAFIARVHDGACQYFHVVLGPDYNTLHRAHFHVDMGRYRICR